MAQTLFAFPGVCFGGVCGLIGVGGANLFVPFLLKTSLDIRHAMATASALAGISAQRLRSLMHMCPMGHYP
jgi:uncharacterized membrane protein YfcA